MIVLAGLVVMVALGVAGCWHLRPSRHPRSVYYQRKGRQDW